MPVETSIRLTYDDYVVLPNDGRRHEIIDGELYVNPAPARKHQVAVGNLHALLWNYAHRSRSGSVFVSPFDVLLSDSDIVQPDVLFVSNDHRERATERGVVGAPDLVIEVLSESTRRLDEGLKRKQYDRYGVSEYWIVDPETRSIVVYRRGATLLERVETTEPLTSPLLPGFSIDVHEIFAE